MTHTSKAAPSGFPTRSIRVSDQQWEHWRERSKEIGLNISTLIRMSVSLALTDNKKKSLRDAHTQWLQQKEGHHGS